MVSVSRPLNGRERPAVKVNSAIIYPLYAPPPILLRYDGSSGISMLKLDENRNELAQSNPNFILYIGAPLFWIMTGGNKRGKGTPRR
jgi:hypothetical protein